MKYDIKITKIIIQCLPQCYPINHSVFLTLELQIIGCFTLESLRNKQLDLVFKAPSNLAATSLSRLSPSRDSLTFPIRDSQPGAVHYQKVPHKPVCAVFFARNIIHVSISQVLLDCQGPFQNPTVPQTLSWGGRKCFTVKPLQSSLRWVS